MDEDSQSDASQAPTQCNGRACAPKEWQPRKGSGGAAAGWRCLRGFCLVLLQRRTSGCGLRCAQTCAAGHAGGGEAVRMINMLDRGVAYYPDTRMPNTSMPWMEARLREPCIANGVWWGYCCAAAFGGCALAACAVD